MLLLPPERIPWPLYYYCCRHIISYDSKFSDSLSAIEILLIVLGSVAALTIITIFVCICYCYHLNEYYNARRKPVGPNPHYDYGMDPYDRRSTPMYYPHQSTRPRYGYPRNWDPEATRTYYCPEKHLYGHSRYWILLILRGNLCLGFDGFFYINLYNLLKSSDFHQIVRETLVESRSITTLPFLFL